MHCFRKLHGDAVSGLSYAELGSLRSLLEQGILSVDEQIEKADDEFTVKQIAECQVMGSNWSEWKNKNDDEDILYQETLSRRRTALRRRARELRLSTGCGSHQLDHRHPDPKILGSVIDGLTVEKERLRLWNDRMIGKELDGMGFHELMVFKIVIQNALFKVTDEKYRSNSVLL
ncbi:unnamed protein product [Microthlaspi erraticum]|uniref:Uncharacterized protein n=1 Tax=Microthlaspi erraticum TaxID=1685480 RepID=A0A6D2K677_9BRAS|nr:unnamed protein product [Microthlaspi erraticum]CAA7060198.1 unnamed protein product [Microthlaspi erraticum]